MSENTVLAECAKWLRVAAHATGEQKGKFEHWADALEAATQWRPIATAPEDQRSILAMHENSGIMQVCWKDAYSTYYTGKGGMWTPTHWMPLPPPPDRDHE